MMHVRMEPNTVKEHQRPARIHCELSFLLLVLVLPPITIAVEAGPKPIGQWDALRAKEVSLPDLSGNGNVAHLKGVTLMNKVEDLVERPCLFFDGNGSYVEIANAPALNPKHVTISVWFKPPEGAEYPQLPLVLKSLPTHTKPWYQYGVFVMNTAKHPQSVSVYLSIGGQLTMLEGRGAGISFGWHQLVATYDGARMRLFCDGKQLATQTAPPGGIDAVDTPLLFGAYGNLEKTPDRCFQGYIAKVTLHDAALSPEAIRKRYDAEKDAFPKSAEQGALQSEYAQRINHALRQTRDIWAEEMIASGGATYDKTKDYLRPLFLSTGQTNKTFGVHNLLFGQDGGEPPYLVPVVDGSRVAANRYDSKRDIECFVGPAGKEKYGGVLDRLEGPTLEGRYYPILRTGYVDAAGVRYTQECFAGRVPGVDHIVAFLKLTARKGESNRTATTVRFDVGGPGASHLKSTGEPTWDGSSLRFAFDLADGAPRTIYLVWSPDTPLPDASQIDAAAYAKAKADRKTYWDAILNRGVIFDVPEPLVMDVQRNHLIQNCVMRWRYSLGSVVYHGSFYQPESSDAMTVLAYFGHLDAARDGLSALVGMAKGKGPEYYTNWERGEKLSHGALHYHLTKDAAFIGKHTPTYVSYCEDFRRQIEADPHGLLRKERHCGDIPKRAYCTFHQAVCWRGMRDMAEVWRQIGKEDLYETYAPVAAGLHRALHQALAKSSKRLPDGSLFVSNEMLEPLKVFDPITETRLGSYWNLVMPYAFASGLWEMNGSEMDGIVRFLHHHGGMLLGLVRFNYYPTPIGSYRPNGLPGYCTPGFDNVYLPNYTRVLADRDMAERLIVSFYGKLAHGQTRNTFVSGEGETVGVRPGQFYRSCYGTPCSANNSTFLLMLRLMLIREWFDPTTGVPKGLFLAHATPRAWLADGKRIVVRGAPTGFGPIDVTIESSLASNRVRVRLRVPGRDPIAMLKLKLRVPEGKRIRSVSIEGQPHGKFDPKAEVIDLTGLTGERTIEVMYR